MSRSLFSRIGLSVWLLLGLAAATARAAEGGVGRAADLRLDFSRATDGRAMEAGMEAPEYALAVRARFDPATQRLDVTGTYRVTEPLTEGAMLSYQVYDDAGELLLWDGARFAWSDDGRSAEFVLTLPMVDEQPGLSSIRVQFNAVREGEFWYHERFPEVRFAAIELVNLPARDRYRAGWTWIPAVLPAQTRVVIPASWTIGYRNEERSGFAATLDVLDPAHEERTEARRLPFGAAAGDRRSVFRWLPMGAMQTGVVDMRPGLVWDDVRWYSAVDWFPYHRVRLIPPLLYVGLSLALATGLGLAWGWIRRWPIAWLRGAGRVVVLAGWAWLAANLVVTGYWMAVVLLGAVAGVRRRSWSRPGLPTYLVVWCMLAFIEIYWGRISGVARVRMSATLLSLAAWALVLLPLVFMRRRWLRRGLGIGAVLGWLIVSTAAVIYFQFFQDFPSVENALYARQVADLGDSIVSLVEQRHLIPVLVIAAAVLIWWWPNAQRNTQRANT